MNEAGALPLDYWLPFNFAPNTSSCTHTVYPASSTHLPRAGARMDDLFKHEPAAPLAEALRPRTIEEVIGQ
ncbi:MAG: hypothetical protein QFF03_25300, partial [Pseudomonadota bacterium]|nr:hypothetical protein [Pseudomonadota bacterium]